MRIHMKNYSKYLLVIWLCLFGLGGSAQSIMNPTVDTIRWEYGDVKNERRGANIKLSGSLISYGSRGFLWIQNGVDYRYSFKILSQQGGWQDANRSGEITYRAVCEGIEGTVRIYKTRTGTNIHLDFKQGGQLTPDITLKIFSIKKM